MNAQQLFQLITVDRPTPQQLQQQQQLPQAPINQILPLLFQMISDPTKMQPMHLLKVMIQLKNCLDAKNEQVKLNKQNQWKEVPYEFKINAHNLLINLLHNLPTNMKPVAQALCEVISIIASYDLPIGHWDDLISQLIVTNISANAQDNCILTLALITEKMNDSDIQRWLPDILPKFVTDVHNVMYAKNKLLGLKNMINHRGFAFTRMIDIYGVLTDPSADITNAEICSVYLDALVVVIQECYLAFKEVADDKFYLFLSNIMEKHLNDVDMMKKVLDVFCELGKIEISDEYKSSSKNILARNYQDLFGKLVTIMGRNIKQMFEDDDDEGENQNNVVVVVLEIFMFMTLQQPDEFVKFILNQLNGMIQREPIYQYIATMIFSRLIEGNASIELIGNFFMQMSLNYGKTTEIIIKIATADVIIRMLEQYPNTFIPDQINYLIEATFITFQSSKDNKFAVAGCKLLGAFYENLTSDEKQKQVLMNHSQTTIQLMQMIIAQRNPTCKRNALNALIPIIEWFSTNNGSDKIDVIYNFILQCIKQFGGDPKLVSNCLEVLAECFKANAHIIRQNPQKYNLNGMMQGLYNYLSNPDTYDAALTVIVAVSEVMEEHFAQYLQAVLQHLMNNFQDISQKDIIEKTCETIGSIAKGVRKAFQQFTDIIVKRLIQMIQMNEIERTTKIFIINAIGGIAEGIGFEAFGNYRNGVIGEVMKLMTYYLQLQLDLDDEDTAEFFQDLIFGVFDFFASLVKNGNPQQFNFINQPMQLIAQIHQRMCPIPGKVKGEVVYSGICQFLFSLTVVAKNCNNVQMVQQIYNQQILEIVQGADGIVNDIDDYEGLRDPVEDLYEILKQMQVIQ